MPRGLYRIHHSGHSHFVTFSCYRRQPFFHDSQTYDLFLLCLERMRQHFQMLVYGYVVMPEHVHLLLSEPEKDTLADALHFLKLSITKRLRSQVSAQKTGANLVHHISGSFWQRRYYDRNVRDDEEFISALKYIHRRVAHPVNLLLRNNLHEGGPSRLLLAGWGFSFAALEIHITLRNKPTHYGISERFNFCLAPWRIVSTQTVR
jgi:REP-associated tyrosine transposase